MPCGSRAARGGRGIARSLSVLALLLILTLWATGCSTGSEPAAGAPTAAPAAAGAPSPTTATAFPFTLTGSDGSAVRLTAAPSRVISLSPGSTETLFAIGAGNQLVAADRFSNEPDAANGLPKVEYSRPSIESLAAFKPDLILGSGRQKDMLAAMQSAGLPVVMLEEPGTVAGVLERIRLLGRVTGHTTDAERVATSVDARIKAVQERIAAVSQPPSVFHEVSFSAGTYTATSRSFVGDLYAVLRARNIADGAQGQFPQLSQEVIVAANPDVIILADGREGVTVDAARQRPGWAAVAAVKRDRVYLLTDTQADMVSRPGPRIADAVEQLAKLLYPDRF